MFVRILSFLLLIICWTPVFSQEDTSDTGLSREKPEKKEEKVHKGFIGISAGPSFPVGNYAKSDWNNENSGFAQNGYNFNGLDLGIKFVPSFGLVFSFKGANIPMDVQTIANNYAQEYGGEFVVKSSRWNFGGIYVGPLISIPTKIVEVDFRFQTGLMLAFTPEMEIKRGQEFVKQEASVGPSLSIVLGGGLRVHLSKRLSLITGVEYFKARPVFTVEYSDNNSIQSETVYQDITTINTTFGIALRIF